MEITEIIVRKRFVGGPLYGIVSVVFDGALAVHDIKVAKTPNGGLTAIMPKRVDEFGRSRDVVHPISEGLRTKLEREIGCKLE